MKPVSFISILRNDGQHQSVQFYSLSLKLRVLLDGVIFLIPTFQMHTFGLLFGIAKILMFSTTKIAEVIRDQKILKL